MEVSLNLGFQNFIFAEDNTNILFFNVTINDINCSNSSSFLQTSHHSTITFSLSNLYYIYLLNSYFLLGNDSKIMINQCSINSNVLKMNSNFIKGNIYVIISNSIIHQNKLFNSSFFTLEMKELSEFYLNNSLFTENQGDFFESFIFRISSSNSLIKLQNTIFLNNFRLKTLVFIEKVFNFIFIENLTFEGNCVSKIMHLKFVDFLLIDSLIFIKNNLKNNFSAGPCLMLEEVIQFKINNINIIDNFGISNIPGIAIIQTLASLLSESKFN